MPAQIRIKVGAQLNGTRRWNGRDVSGLHTARNTLGVAVMSS